jgi:hypothetical protein
MRAVVLGISAVIIVGAVVTAPAAAQAPAAQAPAAGAPPSAEKKAPNSFSGLKLVDLKARKAETTVSMKLGEDAMTIVDPAAKTEVARLSYSGTTASHRVSSAPPPVAGEPATAATQPMSAPMYMGKTPHNWLTLKSGSDTIVLRVSEKVYAQLKDALASHNVQVEEEK